MSSPEQVKNLFGDLLKLLFLITNVPGKYFAVLGLANILICLYILSVAVV